jgi:hypothetical protein
LRNSKPSSATLPKNPKIPDSDSHFELLEIYGDPTGEAFPGAWGSESADSQRNGISGYITDFLARSALVADRPERVRKYIVGTGDRRRIAGHERLKNATICSIDEGVVHGEISALVHSVRSLLAFGALCAGSIPDRVPAVDPFQNFGNCRERSTVFYRRAYHAAVPPASENLGCNGGIDPALPPVYVLFVPYICLKS